MKTKTLLLLLLIASGISVAQKHYYKGNTHTHSYPLSGDATTTWTPEVVVAAYKAAGYDFLVFTNHVAYFDFSALSSPDLTVFSGEEAGISGSGRWGHFTAMKIQSQIGGRDKTHQQLLDEIAAQGGIGFLNHPRWSVIPITALQVINDMKQNLRHFEVYNVNTDTPTRFDTSLWDSVLTTGRLLFGVASDDAHKESHLGKGWICVYASSKHPDTLFNAIRNGEFYASNGIELDTIGYSPEKLYVRSPNGTRVTFIGSSGRQLAVVHANEAAYTIMENEGYVRAEISNSLNQTAWTQPWMLPQTTDVGQSKSSVGPETPTLYQNFPNPFNPSTAISYQLSAFSFVNLRVYDVLGRSVATLANAEQHPGRYQVTFDAGKLTSGVYVCTLSARSTAEVWQVSSVTSKRMLLMK
ncbi:MAG: hypothetical protein HW389_3241 [Bacteroidetes bacterium]|nr:hypothetical protein [Bacteroidota bacterium]